uniref:Uncharacterized protein n=1 Tax=Solanum tuberosum TaxID=4113 RepID=M1DUS5_SOLTU
MTAGSITNVPCRCSLQICPDFELAISIDICWKDCNLETRKPRGRTLLKDIKTLPRAPSILALTRSINLKFGNFTCGRFQYEEEFQNFFEDIYSIG